MAVGLEREDGCGFRERRWLWTNLEGGADLDVLASLHRVNLADQEASDPRLVVDDAVDAPAHFDQGDHTDRRVAHRI